MEKRKVGRPAGYRMSERSRQKTSKSMLGKKHSPVAKQRISEGVTKYRETGAPIELILESDLAQAKHHFKNRYWNLYLPNPVVGEPGYWMRLSRVMMEQHLSRKLKRGEEVHHLGSRDQTDLRFLRLASSKIEHCMLDKFKKRQIQKYGESAYYKLLEVLL